jgi:phage terminase large subunit
MQRLTPSVPPPTNSWPPDYVKIFHWRQEQAWRYRKDPALVSAANVYYAKYPLAFIQHWGITCDQRNAGTDLPVHLPFVLFPKQKELLQFFLACLRDQENGLVEKSRGMGATWLAVAFSVWLWRYLPGASIGWGSRKSELVDKIGVMDSIFEKIREYIRWLPKELWPEGFDPDEHMSTMRIINPAPGGGTIAGEGGDNIGRGGRNTVYIKDESAHYERPERIEAALESNTNCQIDISSVHGVGNVFHRKREAGVDWRPGIALPKGRTRVFVMDWRDHPNYDQEWYERKRKDFLDKGLKHVFAQEVERSYAASVIGTIIPVDWVQSAIDAHLKLRLSEEGGWCAGLDIADEGAATNALAQRKGIILRELDEWGEGDTGYTARKAVGLLKLPTDLQYDCMGVGAGVKAETNRLKDEKVLPRDLRIVPWAAGGEVLNPDKHIIPNDRASPLNKDFYQNLKAQAWWEVRRKFELTHRAVHDPTFCPDVDDLISLDSRLPLLHKLVKELSQPTFAQSSLLKLMVNKTPDGTKSPNCADAVIMCYWPMPYRGPMVISGDVIARLSMPEQRMR